MIVWIDGTPGVGKTTVANKLKCVLGEKVELFESDYYFDKVLKEITIDVKSTYNLRAFGGFYPQNNKRFIQKFRKLIEEKTKDSNKIFIIDMALTQITCKENLFDYFQDKDKKIFHIILTADIEIIKNRIKKDKNRINQTDLSFLESNISFLDNNYQNAIRIKTDNRNIDDIVEEIINIISS